jgi:hypothetical protein
MESVHMRRGDLAVVVKLSLAHCSMDLVPWSVQSHDYTIPSHGSRSQHLADYFIWILKLA